MLDIKQKRKELGIGLQELATIIGVAKSTVHRWENGIIKNMKKDKIEVLAKALNVETNEILGIKPKENNAENEIIDKICKNYKNLILKLTPKEKKELLTKILNEYKKDLENFNKMEV